MPTVLSPNHAFPAGTDIEVYPLRYRRRDRPPADGLVAGGPITVAEDGTADLSALDLTAGEPYVAYAQVGGVDRYIRFTAND